MAVIKTIAEQFMKTTACPSTNCQDFLGKILALGSGVAARLISTDGFFMSGEQYDYAGHVYATSPPLISPNTYSEQDLVTIFSNIVPCICTHFDPATGAMDVVDFVSELSSTTSSLDSIGTSVSPTQLGMWVNEAVSGSKYCASGGCRRVIKTLYDILNKMGSTSTVAPPGTCTMDHSEKCLPSGMDPLSDILQQAPPDVCSVPDFGASASMKFPLRAIDATAGPAAPGTLIDSYTSKQAIYWLGCYLVERCPVEAPLSYTLIQELTLGVELGAFNATQFKHRFAAYLQATGIPSISASGISVSTTANADGSTTVAAQFTVYTESDKSTAQVSLSPAAVAAGLSTHLQVPVNSVGTLGLETEAPPGSGDAQSSSGPGLPPAAWGAIVGVPTGLVILFLGYKALCAKSSNDVQKEIMITNMGPMHANHGGVIVTGAQMSKVEI